MINEEPISGKKRGDEIPGEIVESMVPTKSPGVTIRDEMEEDERFVLFNADNELVLVINSTGKFIIENCTGNKSVARIIKDISGHFNVSDDIDLSSVVRTFIAALLRVKCVTVK